jgi:hypothetical protein
MADRLPWFRCFPSALLGAMAGLKADEGLIYITVLLRIYETGGPVHESGRTLSRRTGLTERRASAAVEWLCQAGKLARLGDGLLDSASTHAEIQWQTERRSDQSSAGKASAAKRQKTSFETKNDASVKTDDPVEGENPQQNQQNGAAAVQQPFNHLEEETEQKEDKLLSDAQGRFAYPAKAFEAWYLRYPHKVGKGAAEAKFERIRKSGKVAFQDLVDGLDRYIRDKPPERDWCNPATWLHQKRWTDEPATNETANLFGGPSSGRGPARTSFAPVATAVANVRDRRGLGSRGGQGGDRPGDAPDHAPDRDNPTFDDTEWTPARSYHEAHH